MHICHEAISVSVSCYSLPDLIYILMGDNLWTEIKIFIHNLFPCNLQTIKLECLWTSSVNPCKVNSSFRNCPQRDNCANKIGCTMFNFERSSTKFYNSYNFIHSDDR